MKKETSCNIARTTLAVLLAVLATLQLGCAFDVNANEIPVRYDETQLWRIHNISNAIGRQTQAPLPELLEKKYDVNIWRDHSQYLDISIDKKHVADAKSFLREFNLKPEILHSNVQQLFDNEKKMGINLTQAESGRRSFKAATSGMNWYDYQTFETIQAYMREIRDKYPSICTLYSIGRTAQGRELLVLRISENPNDYKKIWIDGGIHAREWISPATVTFIIDRLLSNWQQQPAYIKQKTWYIMPVMNPDGYAYSKTQRLWRKNRAVNRGSTCVGVDLNRNFETGWSDGGSSTNPCSDVYRGASPGSELETAAVTKFLRSIKSNLQAYLTYHSYSQVIVYPWAYKSEKANNAVELQSVAEVAAKAIRSKTGYIFKASATYEAFGNAGGGSDDWARAALGTRFVYTVELRDKGQFGFVLPPNQILDAGEEGYIIADTVARAI